MESRTWFDNLPAEVIFTIFDYLSNNDIVYTFFFVNQRFQNFLLQNREYLILNFPTSKLDTWRQIFLVIGIHIESLNITSINLVFSLKYFPNLKSINITSQYGCPDEHLNELLKSKILTKLISFKINEKKIDSRRQTYCYMVNRNDVLKQVFTKKSSLITFQFSLNTTISPEYLTTLQTNSNLRSLTLFLNKFQDIFTILSYAPNLEYFNVHCAMLDRRLVSINNTNSTLKQFHLTSEGEGTFITSDDLINGIKHFSSSLVCLSLNLISLNIKNTDAFPFNNIKLRQFLESMTKLQHFYLYARLDEPVGSNERILSQFQDQYWFDHQWYFGMHGRYLYTLPFYFDYLYEFYGGFEDVNTSNPEILTSNSRIWYNVKSIDLDHASTYDVYFLEELKRKMPKLICINLNTSSNPRSISCTNDGEENDDTTMKYENAKEWFNNGLTHLNHLILSSEHLSTVNNPLFDLLNKRIQRLDINNLNFPCPELTETIYASFPDIQYIYFTLNDAHFDQCEPMVNIVKEISKTFKNIPTLIISYSKLSSAEVIHTNERLGCFLLEKITKGYKIKINHEWILLSKMECDNKNTLYNRILSPWRTFSFRQWKK